MPGLPKPTIDQLLTWRDKLRSQFGQLGTEIDYEESLYYQQFLLESPGGALTVKTGSAPSDVDAAVDTLTPVGEKVAVPPALGRKKYRAQADKLSLAGKALLQDWRKDHDTVRDVVTDQCMRRVGIARVLKDSSRWPQRPSDLNDGPEKPEAPSWLDEIEADDDWRNNLDQTRQTELTAYEAANESYEEWEEQSDQWEVQHRKRNPILLERRDPRYTYWKENSYTHELIIVVEDYYITVLEAKQAYWTWPRARRILSNREDDEQIRINDIWYDRWRCMLMEDQPVFPLIDGIALHDYPELPYALAPFREIPHEEPARQFRGMLTNAAALYPMESQVLTMHVWMLAWNSWRTYKGHLAEGRKLYIIPGQFVEVNPLKGETVELMEGSPVPPELMNTAGLFDSYIQRNGVAQGPRSSEGTRSASQLWAIQAQRQLKIEAAKQSLKRFYEKILHLAMQIIEYKLDGETLVLPVVGKDATGEDYGVVRINAKDIAEYDNAFQVDFGQRLDPALLEQAKVLMEMAFNNWMPMEESWRLSGLTEYPQMWGNDLVRQGIERMPFIMEAIAMQALAEELKDDPDNGPGVPGGIYEIMKAKLMQAQQQQQSPLAPQAGATPASPHNEAGPEGRPANGNGSNLPTAPATPQRAGRPAAAPAMAGA